MWLRREILGTIYLYLSQTDNANNLCKIAMIAFRKPVSNSVRPSTLIIYKYSTKWRFLQMFAVIAV
jgi:hypothetical protein